MGDVYRCARQTVLWLGPETSSSERALEILEEIGLGTEVDAE